MDSLPKGMPLTEEEYTPFVPVTLHERNYVAEIYEAMPKGVRILECTINERVGESPDLLLRLVVDSLDSEGSR